MYEPYRDVDKGVVLQPGPNQVARAHHQLGWGLVRGQVCLGSGTTTLHTTQCDTPHDTLLTAAHCYRTPPYTAHTYTA